MARLVLEQLTKTFAGPGGEVIRAVDQIDLTVEPGELLVLTGPSGCGKTTTLRLIAGLEQPGSGSISLDGRVVNKLPPKARDVAMVFQRPALFPQMTVFENMAFGLRIRKFPRAEIEKRVTEAAATLGLESYFKRLPLQLSGGQQQRVALGRAIVRHPQLLLLDEPLSNLDAPLRNQLRQELAALQRRLGVTSIYVTHDQQEALALGQRIAVMNEGKILEIAPPAELYSRPRHLFVARFIGWPPMNLLPGRILCQAERLVFEPACLTRPAPVKLQLDPQAFPGSERYGGRDIILGIRPEHVLLATATGTPAATETFPFLVDSIECAGSDNLVRLKRESAVLVARLSARPLPEVGRTVSVSFAGNQILFYDAASGLLLP